MDTAGFDEPLVEEAPIPQDAAPEEAARGEEGREERDEGKESGEGDDESDHGDDESDRGDDDDGGGGGGDGDPDGDPDDFFTVDRILGRRARRVAGAIVVQYLVAWEGYRDRTWETAAAFVAAKSFFRSRSTSAASSAPPAPSAPAWGSRTVENHWPCLLETARPRDGTWGALQPSRGERAWRSLSSLARSE